MAKVCMKAFVSGRVQGVSYRASTRKKAQSLDVTGWAKNLDDGRVEVMLCGEDDAVENVVSWLSEGPPLSRVSEVTTERWDWHEYKGFLVL